MSGPSYGKKSEVIRTFRVEWVPEFTGEIDISSFQCLQQMATMVGREVIEILSLAPVSHRTCRAEGCRIISPSSLNELWNNKECTLVVSWSE